MRDDGNIVKVFLEKRQKEFLKRWKLKVLEISKAMKNAAPGEEPYIPGGYELERLFYGYMEIFQGRSDSPVLDLLKEKIREGFLLSTLERINASFMDIARDLFQEEYPAAFDLRTEGLSRLSRVILEGEVAVASYYEKYLHDFNKRLRENAETLKRHNTSLVEFVDLATHQLQTPLWSILGFVSKLRKKHADRLDEEGRHCLDRITANVSEMHQLIEDVTGIMIFDQNPLIKKEMFFSDLIDQGIKRVCREVDERFECFYSRDREILITGDPHYLKELVYILFKNSACYVEHDLPGRARIRQEGNCLFFEDEGIGIEERFFELVFKPMERLKEKDVSGSGMGLALARKIVEAHGGSIEFVPPSGGKGACLKIEFPRQIVRIRDSKKE